MNRDLRHIFQKVLCYFLALVIAASTVIIVTLGVGSGMLRSQTYVQRQFEKQNSQLLSNVQTVLENVLQDTDLPTKAYTESIKAGHMQTALHMVSTNVIQGFKTDFSESKFLYGYFRSGILDFTKKNGIAITEDQVVRDSCYAVDAFNQVCGDESTNYILPFQQTYTKNPLYAIIISVVAIIVSFVALSFITFGRHKKYDYIALGISTGGAVLFALPLFAIIMKYSQTLHFTDVNAYNMGLADTIDGIFKIYMLIGVVIFILGTILLYTNYSYYKKKTVKLRTEHEINMKLRKEFINDHIAAKEEAEKQALENAIMEEAIEKANEIDN